MNLTLSIDDEVVARARKRAEQLGTSVNQLVRDYLEQLNGLSVGRRTTGQPIAPGAALTPTKAKLPQGVDSIAAYALKALARIRELRTNLSGASQVQQRILEAFEKQHQLYGLAA